MQAILSFEQAPPMSAPLRFFLTAPLFGVLAGLILLIGGEAALVSRWSPLTLAVVHALTIGVLLQTMLGALIQILPVVVGAHLERPLLVARVVHSGLVLGTLALIGAFLRGEPAWYLAAGVLLVAAIGTFLVAAGHALARIPHTSPTIPAVKLALVGLLLTAFIGVLLLGGMSAGWAVPLAPLTDVHAAWGLGGFGGALIAGVAYVVVPMFQLTPGYRARFSRWFVPVLVGAVVAWSAARLVSGQPWAPLAGALAGMLLLGALTAFAVVTMRLQKQSKRSRPDTTFRFWQLGMAATIAVAAVGTLGLTGLWPGEAALLPGVLVLAGVFLPLINGMLYKIVPFLAWLHLQNLAVSRGGARVPHMGEFLGEPAMRRQWWLHLAALAALSVAVFLPAWFVRPAGLLLAASCLLLEINLWMAVRHYRRSAARFAAPPVEAAAGTS